MYAQPWCQLFKPQMKFLGHLVDQSGILLQSAKVEAITKYPGQSMYSQLLSFLGEAFTLYPNHKQLTYCTGWPSKWMRGHWPARQQ